MACIPIAINALIEINRETFLSTIFYGDLSGARLAPHLDFPGNALNHDIG
jgi:hypothetical protein